MKKIFLSIVIVIMTFSSCQTNKSKSDTDTDTGYWKDTLSIRDTTFMIPTDTMGLDARLTLPANSHKNPLIIFQSVMDKDLSWGKPPKPYRDLATGLGQQGIASLCFDGTVYQYTSRQKDLGGFISAFKLMNQDLDYAFDIAKTLPNIDTARIYVLSMGNILIPEAIQKHPEIKGIIMASTPARPLMDGMIEMLQTMAKKDTIWESALKEMDSQYANLQKLGTKAFNDSISLPMDLSKEEWKELKDYALADEMQSLPIPIFILFGRDDISLSQKEFDTWKIKLANKPQSVCKQYPELSMLLIAPNDSDEKNKSRHVPIYVVNDIAEWINSTNNN